MSNSLPSCYRCGQQPCICPIPLAYGVDVARQAADLWQFNCGPAALTAVLGVIPDVLRPHLREFEKKGYTNPRLMYSILKGIGLGWTPISAGNPLYGLVRVQWEGPWTKARVPIRARYRHTHWIATDGKYVFDVNAICVGGWVSVKEWEKVLVPWLLRQVEPKSNGRWHRTHRLSLTHENCEIAARRLEQEVLPMIT